MSVPGVSLSEYQRRALGEMGIDLWRPEAAEPVAVADAWGELQQRVAGCRACALAEGRTQAVFGTGDPAATWMIIGEAPGAEEDRRGEPFVGPRRPVAE